MTCQNCPKRKTCKKPCPDIEAQLQKEGIHSRDWIRPKMPANKRDKGQWREVPFSALRIDKDGDALDSWVQ